jgi:FKBP-type peptidyl-prolyl cis-trans isomerase (trigger factor)
MSNYTIKKITENEKESARTVEVEISTEEIGKHRLISLKALSEKADLPGFRKGHVPEKVIIEKLGETGILEEAINSWLKEGVLEILKKEASDALAFPRVNVTKAVPGNPVELSLFFPLKPKIKLPDYKVIASSKNKKVEPEEKVEEKEIDEALLRLRKYALKASNPASPAEIKDEDLPPITDEFAVAIGGGKTVAELRERVSKDLLGEKKIRAKEKHRLEIIEEILKKTETVMPEILIESEVDKMEMEFESDVKRMGLSLDDYLKNTKKTREDARKEWKPVAEKRAKVNVILAEIKTLEKIEADKEKVEHEMKHLLEHHKDVDVDNARAYVERMFSNEKVFEFLESQK